MWRHRHRRLQSRCRRARRPRRPRHHFHRLDRCRPRRQERRPHRRRRRQPRDWLVATISAIGNTGRAADAAEPAAIVTAVSACTAVGQGRGGHQDQRKASRRDSAQGSAAGADRASDSDDFWIVIRSPCGGEPPVALIDALIGRAFCRLLHHAVGRCEIDPPNTG